MIEEIYNKLSYFYFFPYSKLVILTIKFTETTKKKITQLFSSNLDHSIMHFKSFDWLSGHGISALYHAPEKEAAKSSVLSCKMN